MRVLRHTCTYHCSACGRHFHSLKAFDTHRVGDFSDEAETWRHCESPLDIVGKRGNIRLEAIRGVCEIQGENADGGRRATRNATIWTIAGAAERSEALSRLPTARLRPSEHPAQDNPYASA